MTVQKGNLTLVQNNFVGSYTIYSTVSQTILISTILKSTISNENKKGLERKEYILNDPCN